MINALDSDCVMPGGARAMKESHAEEGGGIL